MKSPVKGDSGTDNTLFKWGIYLLALYIKHLDSCVPCWRSISDMTPWVKFIFCKTMLVRIMCQVSGVISVWTVQRKLQIRPFQISHPYSSICPWIISTEAFFVLFPGLYDVLPHHICVRKLFFFQTHSFATDLTAKTHKQQGMNY